MTRMGRPQLLQCGQFCAAPVVSKLAEMEARVLLPLGEGGPKGRMRVHFLPSPGPSRPPLPKGEGNARNSFPNRESHETRINPASGGNHISEFGQERVEPGGRSTNPCSEMPFARRVWA